jgi:hypothetical protein
MLASVSVSLQTDEDLASLFLVTHLAEYLCELTIGLGANTVSMVALTPGERLAAQQIEAPQRVIGSSQVAIDEAVQIYVIRTRPAFRIVVDAADGRPTKVHKSNDSKSRVASEEGALYARSLHAKRGIGEVGTVYRKITTDLRGY